MADLLGSILSSMEKPPSVDDKQKKREKERKRQLEKLKAEDRKRKDDFRSKVEKKVSEFINDTTRTRLKFPPVDKIYRSIIHDVAEVAGATSFSFGEREEERYIIIFKKEYAPTDEELNAYRRGETWDPEEARVLAKQKADEKEEMRKQEERTQPTKVAPATDYMDKYKKIVGDESAVDGARNLTPNKQFGFVPSENKKDKRSVEETMNAIRAKKKQKTVHTETTDSVPGSSLADS